MHHEQTLMLTHIFGIMGSIICSRPCDGLMPMVKQHVWQEACSPVWHSKFSDLFHCVTTSRRLVLISSLDRTRECPASLRTSSVSPPLCTLREMPTSLSHRRCALHILLLPLSTHKAKKEAKVKIRNGFSICDL
jgi:hypothetical protein